MKENVYLSEEKYQKTAKKLTLVAIVVLIVGLCVGGGLIYNGIAKPNSSKVEMLEKELEEKRQELINKGIVYDSTAKYTDGEVYDLKIITKALDPSFDHCAFDEYKNNSITKEYCAAKNSVSDFSSATFIIVGVFVTFTSFLISFVIFMTAKGRDVAAFSTQQVIPVAQEGIEKMAPSIGKTSKEIAKGIKDGLIDEEE